MVESTYKAGDLGLIPGLGIPPGGGHGNPLQYSCLENPYGQKGLVGYSPWGRKELDTTEQLSQIDIVSSALAVSSVISNPLLNSASEFKILVLSVFFHLHQVAFGILVPPPGIGSENFVS